MLQSYLSDFGNVDIAHLSPDLRHQVSTALLAATTNTAALSKGDVGKIIAYIAQLEEALVDEDVHVFDEASVLDKLKSTTGFDVKQEAYTLEYMRAEDV